MQHFFAVIDLGSNSLRMTINRLDDSGNWCVVEKMRETVRLGSGMSNDGFLCEKSMLRVIEALKGFCEAARQYRCTKTVSVATAAVRSAANRDEFLKRVKNETGLELEVISGSREAYYSFLAVKRTVGIEDGVIFDTGGGSTEISLVKKGELCKSISLPLGAVVLTEKMSGKSQQDMYEFVLKSIEEIPWLGECGGFALYGIGGSARTLAMLYKKKYMSVWNVGGIEIPSSSVSKIYGEVFDTEPGKRRDIEGMDVSRADVILAGITPCKVLMDMTESQSITVCAAGVKEGIFFSIRDDFMKKAGIK